jgi:hypothetical protein
LGTVFIRRIPRIEQQQTSSIKFLAGLRSVALPEGGNDE